ncbi:hypothetical protein [Thalassobaculum salexigens]|uniref:hypothetical protein n=1 Tax=Thalassobaculum salexigens TaxID=455360 RepID=UPI0012EB3CDD|nr:hypothetical protein [Thalassobaculum salexigens]
MAGGLGKVGKPKGAIDRFAAADEAMLETKRSDAYLATPTAAVTPTEPAQPTSSTIKKTLTLPSSTIDQLQAIDTALLRNGRKAKEVELVRAAIAYLATQSDDVIVSSFDGIEKLQRGPKR